MTKDLGLPIGDELNGSIYIKMGNGSVDECNKNENRELLEL